ncbi:MAG TPA: hypothetical protein VMV81_02565, partial [Phycisphaerae bacterium]|nr:hypothetical protein [Phycisphaerae bacterium]
ALRARSVLRSAGVNSRWYSAVKIARRISNKLCFYCGYNLTGNVSGVCPECGRVCGTIRS